jgi:TonB-dependent receptor
MIRRLSTLSLSTAVLWNLFWLPSVIAQSTNGTVAGTAKDTADSPLTAARVQLDPVGKQTVTDTQGQFRITDVAPGAYTLTVSYVGLAPFTKEIKVEGGQVAAVDAVLEVASRSEQVVVTAERVQGEAEAINIERTAENIVQVLPARVITSLPNTNIADAVGRAPSVTLERDEGEGKYVQIRGTEPRLSNVTINGVHVPSPEAGVRNIKLDAVPSDIVERIEVYKTLLPNQDGDAIGGSVNLVTKTPLEKPTYSVMGQGGYTPIQNGRWLNGFNGTVGERFGTNKKLGALFGATYDRNERGIDDLEPAQAIGNFNGTNFAYINSEDFRTYQYSRTRYGFGGSADYNLKPGTTFYVRGLYADFHDYGSTFVYTPSTGAIVDHSGASTTFDNTGNMIYREYIRRPNQGVYSIAMGATHDLSSLVFNYQFAISRGHNHTGQDFPTTYFAGPTGVTFGLNESDPYRPKISALDGTNIFNPAAYSIAGPNSAASFGTVIPSYNSAEMDYQGNASLAKRYTVGTHSSTFEMGFSVRDAHKTQLQNDQFFYASNTYGLDQFLGTDSNPNYYDKFFGGYGPMTNYNKIQSLLASQLTTGFIPQPSRDRIVSDAATWDTGERVYGGYLMNSISLGKVRLQGGLRIEATSEGFHANKVTLNPDGSYNSTVPVIGPSSYINLLPSIQFQYLLEKNTTLRLGYGRGISRANFQDLVPTIQVDPNTSPKSLTVGNSSLKPTKANNYDVLIEHFFQPLGILQGGFFYKALSDPIYPTATFLPQSDPNFPGYLRLESINGPSAHIAGVEVSWQQRLSILPGILNGFGVSANYSYTTSQVTFPAGFSGGRIDHPRLQRQAPNTWNLGMTYDKARFSMRFGVSHNDANIYAYGYVHDPTNPAGDKDPIIGIKGPLGDQYLYQHTQYDIQGSYRAYKGLQFIASGLNLSNEVFGFYTGSPIYPNQREFYKPTVMFGIRWSSGLEY